MEQVGFAGRRLAVVGVFALALAAALVFPLLASASEENDVAALGAEKTSDVLLESAEIDTQAIALAESAAVFNGDDGESAGKDESDVVLGAQAAKTIGSLQLVDGALHVYTWTGSAIKPSVVVKDTNGNVLTEGVDYKLQYTKASGDHTYLDSVSAEGAWAVWPTPLNGNSSRYSPGWTNQFYIASAAHNLANAVVSGPATYTYTGASSLEDVINPTVTLGGVVLKKGYDADYHLFYTKGGWNGSGTLGTHTVEIYGEGNNARGSNTYFGVTTYSYTVVNASAPASNARVDTKTGVKAAGAVIANKSTTEDDKWVKLTVAEPTGDSVVAAAASAKAVAESSGATVKLFDVTLDVVDGDGNVTEHLTNDFDLALTFPVDAAYNGRTATITQIHDGVALAPQTTTVADGAVSVNVNCLSQFVVAVNGEEADEDAAGGNGDADNGDGAVDNPTDDSSSDLVTKPAASKPESAKAASTPVTGDSNTVLFTGFGILALLSAAASILARRLKKLES